MSNYVQTTLFENEESNVNTLISGRRVGLIGKFNNKAALLRRVKEAGADDSSKDGLTRDTQILVIGSDVKQKMWDQLKCYEHDGWHPLQVTEQDLMRILSGYCTEYSMFDNWSKRINIDMSYYNWNPPIVNDDENTNTTIRRSSPLVYDEGNPIYGLEMYVPDIAGVNMGVFRQMIGNFGGYANVEYNDETNVVMLGDETLRKLERGEKDDVILQIESCYNNSSSLMFNVQFTCESDFVNWVKLRVEKYDDEITRELLDVYLRTRTSI